jgi:hypothetical protein
VADPRDLCALGDVKRYLDFTDPTAASTADAELARLITAASSAMVIEAKLPQREDGEAPTFFEDTYRETYHGTGATQMLLRWLPVTYVSSVVMHGVPIPRAATPTAAGFLFDTMAVYLRGYTFARGIKNIQVTYTGGFGADHPTRKALEQAALDLVGLVYRNKAQIGIASKHLGPETISFIQSAMPMRTRDLLARLEPKVAVA